MSYVDTQHDKIASSQAALAKAMGIDDAMKIAKQTLSGQSVDVTAHWETLMKNLGEDVLPATIAGFKGINAILDTINGFFTGSHALDNALGNPGGAVGRYIPAFRYASDALSLGGSFLSQLGGISGGFTPPTQSQSNVIHTQVNLDGRVVAQVLTQHQSDALRMTPAAGSSFDGRMTPIPVQ